MKELNRCNECGSEYFASTSKMNVLCPECAHYLYGYENCKHQFEKGRCVNCYWDGSVSRFIESIKKS